MGCKIFLVVFAVISLTNAVDYYPHHQRHHEQHHQHHYPAHVKYVQPAHAEPIKYIQPAHVKYVHQPIAQYKYAHQPVEHPNALKYTEKQQYVKQPVDYDEPAHYEYGYNVHDEQTGDIKSHSEKRDGDSVQGHYEVLDPDGFKRIVEYTADAHHGFNAVVRREPSDVKIVKKVLSHDPEPVKYLSPAAYQAHHYALPVQPNYSATPVLQKYITPAAVVQHQTPQYHATPEHLKYLNPVQEKFVAKVVKPYYAADPHTSVKYVQPSAHYSHQY